MTIKVIFDTVRQQVWVVRLVQTGESYGLNDSIVHNDEDPLVEFYDPRYPHTDLGQFVSRYNASVLRERAGGGLTLDTGSSEWTVSASSMGQLHTWLQSQERERQTCFA